MLRNKWLPINHHLLHLVGLDLILFMEQNVTYTGNARKQSGQASHVWSDAMIKLPDKLNAAGAT
jgi:hypothetical protein